MSRRDVGQGDVNRGDGTRAGEPLVNPTTGYPPGAPGPGTGGSGPPAPGMTPPGAQGGVEDPPALGEFLVDESILDDEGRPAARTADLGSAGPESAVPEANPAEAMAHEIDSLEVEALDALNAVMKERDEYLDSLRRLQADFENYKKRMLKQQSEASDRALESLVGKLLPVLDTVDLARAHGGSEGVEQIGGPLLAVLVKEGLERIDPKGEPFDPNEHDAVLHEEGDGGPTIAEVLRAGWRWKGRVVRAAMVKVAG